MGNLRPLTGRDLYAIRRSSRRTSNPWTFLIFAPLALRGRARGDEAIDHMGPALIDDGGDGPAVNVVEPAALSAGKPGAVRSTTGRREALSLLFNHGPRCDGRSSARREMLASVVSAARAESVFSSARSSCMCSDGQPRPGPPPTAAESAEPMAKPLSMERRLDSARAGRGDASMRRRSHLRCKEQLRGGDRLLELAIRPERAVERGQTSDGSRS